MALCNDCECFIHCIGIFAIVSLMVGDVVRRTIDTDPSLCMPDSMTGSMADNDTNDTVTVATDDDEFDYPNCSASVNIAVTMAFVSALLMVGAY